MTAAMIIADYVIDKSIELNKSMPNAKLQKVLFFLDVAHLLETNKHLITDHQFEKWSYGPAIKYVYNLYGPIYGSSDISKILDYKYLVKVKNSYDIKIYKYHREDLAQSDRNFIDKYLNSLLNYDMWDLIRESQKDPQWINRNCKTSKNDRYIDSETIEYYQDHQIWHSN